MIVTKITSPDEQAYVEFLYHPGEGVRVLVTRNGASASCIIPLQALKGVANTLPDKDE